LNDFVKIAANDDMDCTVTGIPGMEGLLRRRDLPSICRQELDDPALQLFIKETQAMTQGSPLILNTFDNLEASILSHLAPLFSKIYTIGPLNALMRSRIGDGVPRSLSTFSNLWEADNSCMAWLDSQPLGSVVYVSFGSLAIMTRGFFMELWHGLVNSGKRFLWAIRRDTISDAKGEQAIPVELQEGTKERGLLVDWAPQEEVLAHPSTGGFLTHSGWNSTLESIVAGVPMICWPQIGDQQINSRWVSEVWRIGLDIKDTCDRSTVETMIRTLMKDGREEIMMSMDRIAKLARDCVGQGGSSYHNLDMLIEDIGKI
jgi:UDP:flavonoid glycosyltransferase YjiC (YdhE family)